MQQLLALKIPVLCDTHKKKFIFNEMMAMQKSEKEEISRKYFEGSRPPRR